MTKIASERGDTPCQQTPPKAGARYIANRRRNAPMPAAPKERFERRPFKNIPAVQRVYRRRALQNGRRTEECLYADAEREYTRACKFNEWGLTVVISIINGARAQPTGTDVGRGTLLPTDGMRCIPKRLIPSKLCGRSTFPENAPCGQFAAWESVLPREPPPAWFRRHSCERPPQSPCP